MERAAAAAAAVGSAAQPSLSSGPQWYIAGFGQLQDAMFHIYGGYLIMTLNSWYKPQFLLMSSCQCLPLTCVHLHLLSASSIL